MTTTEPSRAGASGLAYTTAAFSTRRPGCGELLPASLAHAKTPGSSQARCGAVSATWVKFYLLPFREAPEPRCRQCLALEAALEEVDVGTRGDWSDPSLGLEVSQRTATVLDSRSSDGPR